MIINMKKTYALIFFILFALFRAEDAAPETTEASSVESPEVEQDNQETSEPVEDSQDSEDSGDDSLNNQINSTIEDIQKSLLEDGSEAEGVSMTEDNINSLIENLWPSVQNFIEQSLGEVSTLDQLAVDEVTEEEAALIRSNFIFFFIKVKKYL